MTRHRTEQRPTGTRVILMHELNVRSVFIVVGAGLGGLALAFILGQSGHEVTVLEAAPSIGEVS